MTDSWAATMAVAGAHVLAYGSRANYPFTLAQTKHMFEYHYMQAIVEYWLSLSHG